MMFKENEMKLPPCYRTCKFYDNFIFREAQPHTREILSYQTPFLILEIKVTINSKCINNLSFGVSTSEMRILEDLFGEISFFCINRITYLTS